MVLCVAGCAASAHRQSCHGAHFLASAGSVPLLDIRHELIEEKIFVCPTRHVEIAVLVHGRVAAARIGAYYHHLYGLAREYVAVKDVACALVAEP